MQGACGFAVELFVFPPCRGDAQTQESQRLQATYLAEAGGCSGRERDREEARENCEL